MPSMVTARVSSRPSARHTEAADWMLLDQQLCFALYSTSLAMTKLYKPLLAPLALTYPQYLALLVLWERDYLAVNELGERLHLDSGTLTPLLKRMEAAGWVQRERDSEDERRVVVSLTAEGRALRQKARRVPAKLVQATRCNASELASLTQRLQQLRSQLQGADDEAPSTAH